LTTPNRRLLVTRRRFLAGAGLTLGALGSGSLLSACGGGGGSQGGGSDKMKAAWVYIGPTGDAGWTTRHDEGRKMVQEELGDRVETTFVESVPEGATAQRTFEDLAREGNRVIYGTSFGYMDPMFEAAKKYPDTVFMHATGFKTRENMGTYAGAAEEAAYLAGMAAGRAAENNKIGYLAPFPIPEVIRGLNALMRGAREVNPEATMRVVWTSTWFDPDKERQAAQGLADAGVSVIAMQQDSPAAGQVAQDEGLKWAGHNDNMERFAPDAWLTGPLWNWGPFYVETTRQVLEDNWQSEEYYGHMSDGIVKLAPFGKSVDEETRALIEERKQQTIDGEFDPFTGPVRDQDGEVRIPEGETATLEQLLEMDYLVEGCIGDIPENPEE
jgi:basic membrane protein A and related proteins